MTEQNEAADSGIEPWILVLSGNTVRFTDTDPSTIALSDIAHNLSHLARFGGATKSQYSVGQHSLLVAAMVKGTVDDEHGVSMYEKAQQVLAALLHDAAEAYLGDIPRPLKHNVVPNIIDVEHDMLRVIFDKFGLDIEYYNDVVRAADQNACLIERAALLPQSDEWPVDPDAAAQVPKYANFLRPIEPALVRAQFVTLFDSWGKHL